MADRSRYIFWAGVLPIGVLFAAFGCLEKVVRRSGYQLSAIQGEDIAELLVLRVALWSIVGYRVGSQQWNARPPTQREPADAGLEGAVEQGDGADERRPG